MKSQESVTLPRSVSSSKPSGNGDCRTIPVCYVAGTSHCGSTLLALLMDSHPQVTSVGEAVPNVRIQRSDPGDYTCSCGQPIARCAFWQGGIGGVQARGLPFSAQNWTNDYQYKNRLLGRLLNKYSHRPAVRRLQLAAEWFPPLRRRLALSHRVNRAFMEEILDRTGAEVFLDTTKSLRRLYQLLCVEGLEVRVVWLVRDVRAFAYSTRRKGFSASMAANSWRCDQCNAQGLLGKLEDDKVLKLRYEDFCADPAHWLGELCGFLGVSTLALPEMMYPAEHHILGNQMRLRGPQRIEFDEKWRVGLDPEEQEAALSVAGGLHRELGYAD